MPINQTIIYIIESHNPNDTYDTYDTYIKESYNPYNLYDAYNASYIKDKNQYQDQDQCQCQYTRNRDYKEYNELEVTKAAKEALEVVESLLM